jgi:DNA-binding transcriptional LysR family regulator
MLDARRLRVLREVADRGSLSAAADALGYTASAVSQQMAALERETATTLLERNGRGVLLTSAGRTLVEHADAILNRMAEAECELAAISRLRGGRLNIVALSTVAATILPLAIAEFRRRYPAVELTLGMGEPVDIPDLLMHGDADIAISNERDCNDDDGFERVHLLDDPMYVALPVGHRLARRRTVELTELADEPWMLGTTARCPDRLLLMQVCDAAGFKPQIAFQHDDYTAIQGLVAAGVGVALIPDMAAVNVREDIVLRALRPRPPARRIAAVTAGHAASSPATAAMLEILLDAARTWVATRRSVNVTAPLRPSGPARRATVSVDGAARSNTVRA